MLAGGERTSNRLERRLTAVRRHSAVVLWIVNGAKKKHLIEAAPFGCLDQMLRMAVQGRVLGGLCPPSQKLGGSGGHRPPAKIEKIAFFSTKSRKIEKKINFLSLSMKNDQEPTKCYENLSPNRAI